MVLMAPSDEKELTRSLDLSVSLDSPAVIRYPRDNVPPEPLGEDSAWTITKSGGKSRTLREVPDAQATLVAYGSMAWQAMDAAKLLENEGILVNVVDARFCKPLDGEMLKHVFAKYHPVLTIEDHSIINGFGSAVVEHAQEKRYDGRLVTRLGLPDRFIKHASRGEQLKEVGLDVAGLARSVRAAIEETRGETSKPAAKRAVAQLR
jgi:1-deoxy-D-xylulose-5-phosphate synthase